MSAPSAQVPGPDFVVPASLAASIARGRPFIDPLSDALASSPAWLADESLLLRDALREAQGLLDAAKRDGSARAPLARALDLACAYPDDVRLQLTVAQLVERGQDWPMALACWRNVHARFPDNDAAFLGYIQQLSRSFDADYARALVADIMADKDCVTSLNWGIAVGRALIALDQHDAAGALFRAMTMHHPKSVALWQHYLRHLSLRGSLGALQTGQAEARAALGDHHGTFAGSGLDTALAQLPNEVVARINTALPVDIGVMHLLLNRALEMRAAAPPRPSLPVGQVALIGGSLGSGGAERQLVTTALGLQALADNATCPDRFTGPVTVLCRRLGHAHGHDFYLPRLAEAGIEVIDYLHTESWGGSRKHAIAGKDAALVALLPPRLREGVTHLTEQLRHLAPDAVQLWQDGTIIAAGLACLLAGVPRIILNVRTLPPNARTDRWKPEQEPLYRALLSASGVIMTANSAEAARGYEAWLGLPNGSIPVIFNGLAPMADIGGDASMAAWTQFDRSASPGFTTIGIMRMDDNKRPIDWLQIAERVLAQRPDARFILVGDGPLGGAARAFVTQRGLDRQILFTGRTPDVGFWLARSDALLLTSRHEGTPNVLIEAQLAGVPVVTTPAGGAAATVLEGITGFVLNDADTLDQQAAAARLCVMAAMAPDDRAAMRVAARNWAESRYSIDRMIDNSLALFTASAGPGYLAKG